MPRDGACEATLSSWEAERLGKADAYGARKARARVGVREWGRRPQRQRAAKAQKEHYPASSESGRATRITPDGEHPLVSRAPFQMSLLASRRWLRSTSRPSVPRQIKPETYRCHDTVTHRPVANRTDRRRQSPRREGSHLMRKNQRVGR